MAEYSFLIAADCILLVEECLPASLKVGWLAAKQRGKQAKLRLACRDTFQIVIVPVASTNGLCLSRRHRISRMHQE